MLVRWTLRATLGAWMCVRIWLRCWVNQDRLSGFDRISETTKWVQRDVHLTMSFNSPDELDRLLRVLVHSS